MSSSITGHYQIRRRELGQPLNLAVIPPSMLFEEAPDARRRARHITADVVETEISNVPVLSIASTNTDRKDAYSKGMNHREGGWPLNVDHQEVEEQLKFCRRVERDDAYLTACAGLVGTMNSQLRLNSAVDIYETYFDQESTKTEGGTKNTTCSSGATTTGAPGSVLSEPKGMGSVMSENEHRQLLKGVAAQYADEAVGADFFSSAKFTFPSQLFGAPRAAMQGAWTCGSESETIAVAYADTSRGFGSGQFLEAQPCVCLWNMNDASTPSSILYSRAGDATAVACSNKDPHVVVGGSSSGALSTWDTRVGKQPIAVSLPGKAHHDSVTDIKFLMSKQAECFSVGLDGRVLFWDARKLGAPSENDTVTLWSGSGSTTSTSSFSPKMPQEQPATAAFTPTGGHKCSGCCIDYDPMVGGAHKYLIGTVEGKVFNCNRRGKTQALDACYGTIFDVMRCPTNPKMFFAAGDWGFNIFGDELKEPFLSSGCGSAHVTAGRWHPRRPAIILTGNTNGEVCVWDLCQSHARSVMKLKTGSGVVRCLAPHVSGKVVASLDSNGDMNLVSLPQVLQEPFPGEKGLLNTILEREYARERALHGREKRLQSNPMEGKDSPPAPSLTVNMPHILGSDGQNVLQDQLAALGEQYLDDVGYTGPLGREGNGGGPSRSSSSLLPTTNDVEPQAVLREASPEIDTVDEVCDDDEQYAAPDSKANTVVAPQEQEPAPPPLMADEETSGYGHSSGGSAAERSHSSATTASATASSARHLSSASSTTEASTRASSRVESSSTAYTSASGYTSTSVSPRPPSALSTGSSSKNPKVQRHMASSPPQ